MQAVEAHGAQERTPGRGESRRPAEPPPEGEDEVGACEAARPGVQREVRAARTSRAIGLEAGRAPAVRWPVGDREEVQLGGEVSPRLFLTKIYS